MTKKTWKSLLRVVPLLVMLCLMLTGCACKHEWNDANCVTPKTCSLCQVTEGEALGHTYADATCESPKTCTVCKATDGEPLGHTWVDATCVTPKTCSVCSKTEGDALGHTWVEATCQTPKTCSVCKATEGELAEHTWVDATCQTPKTCSVCSKTEGELAKHKWMDATTEKPKTCSVCAKTEGSRIITDSRFKTANCKDLFGTWSGIVEVPSSTIVEQGFNGVLKMEFSIVFNHDGTFEESTKLLEGEQFNQSVEDYYADILFKEFTTQGYSQAQADQAMIAVYGMNVEDYAKKLASVFNWENLVNTSRKGVYYVADEKLHSGTGWNATLESDTYTIVNNTLTIDSLVKQYPGTILTKS